MGFFTNLLTEKYINEPKRQKAAEIFEQALGNPATRTGEFMGAGITYDENGNPIPENVTYRTETNATGLLADVYNPVNQSRFAKQMMAAPGGQALATSMMNQIQQGGQVLDRMDYENQREDAIFRTVRDSLFGTPQTRAPSNIPSVQGRQPVVPNLPPVAPTSQPPSSTVGVGRSPAISPNVRPTGTAADFDNYSALRRQIEQFAIHPTMKDSVKPLLNALDAQWGYGAGAPNAVREWRTAQRMDGYDGTFEDWKTMTRQTIMKDAGTTYNQPVGNDAVKWMNDRGEVANYMDTPVDLEKKGYRLLSTKQQDEIVQMNRAMTLNSQLGDLLFGQDGKGGIYKNWDKQKNALVQRGEMSMDTLMNRFTQNNPDLSTYERLATGTMASTIRAMGEKGALAEGDVKRGEGLLVDMFPADSKEVAMKMHEELQDIFTRGDANRKLIWAAQRQGLQPTGTFDANGRPKFLNPVTNKIVEWRD